MKVHNPTRDSTLATEARRARTLWERFRGLMGRASLDPGEALLLEPELSIHTFFMRFPIDVLYLDREYRVLRADPTMHPNRIGPLFTRGCHAILELPAGTIARTGTCTGDLLHLEQP